MIGRSLKLAGAVAGAVAASQFPAYSQQYLQRLGGAVDELGRVVADFDSSAQAAGLTRQAALEEMTGSDFVERRRDDMRMTITRHTRLVADLEALRDTDAVARALQPQRFTDPQIAQAAWQNFEPAVPATLTGLGFAGAGGALGYGFAQGLLALLGWPFRRRRSVS